MRTKKKQVQKSVESDNIYWLRQRVENQKPFVDRAEKYFESQKQRLELYEKELAEALEKQ